MNKIQAHFRLAVPNQLAIPASNVFLTYPRIKSYSYKESLQYCPTWGVSQLIVQSTGPSFLKDVPASYKEPQAFIKSRKK